MQITGGVDAVLVTDHLPELRTDLVAALAALDVNELTHSSNCDSSSSNGFPFRQTEGFTPAGICVVFKPRPGLRKVGMNVNEINDQMRPRRNAERFASKRVMLIIYFRESGNNTNNN